MTVPVGGLPPGTDNFHAVGGIDWDFPTAFCFEPR